MDAGACSCENEGDVLTGADVLCSSSTDLQQYAESSLDLVITDPPFGGLPHYSELSDFFYVWLRLVLKSKYPDYFNAEYTPKSLEAVANRAREPEDPDGFYQRLLTQCWREAHRALKPGGILAFTFHHSEDEPWVAVLESLFDAGYYLEATYPAEDKQGAYGSIWPTNANLLRAQMTWVQVDVMKRLLKDAGLYEYRDPKTGKTESIDLGFVGEPKRVDANVLRSVLNADLIPVIAPVGVGTKGETYNINADTVASVLARARIVPCCTCTGKCDCRRSKRRKACRNSRRRWRSPSSSGRSRRSPRPSTTT